MAPLVYHDMTNKAPFDLLTTDCVELQALLATGAITSAQLVDIFLDQIDQHNTRGTELNAMICITPRDILFTIAHGLDRERAEGKVRGPLHGIPITIKDNIMTGPEFRMPTTVGSAALKRAVAKKNAPIVDMLVEAGVIVIGKANLSEMAGWKGFGVTTGWSAVGGQTQTPYVIGGVKPGEKILGHSTPAGSSSGSAVSIAAGFAPLALATETDGSIVQPANRASLYGLKATVGRISTEGTAPWSHLTDSIGGMARTAQDLSSLMGILMNDTQLSSSLSTSWEGQRVGFVDPTLWGFVPLICDPDPILIAQQRRGLVAAAGIITKNGGIVKQSVPLTTMDELVLDGQDALEQLWNHDFASSWNKFLKGYQEETPIKTLRDIVVFNREHPDIALPAVHPGQQLLEGALGDILTESQYAKGVAIIRQAARTNGIDKTLADFDLDVIIGPMDGRIPTVAAAAGYPVGTMPLGYSSTNGRAFGACILSKAGGEAKILRAMSAWQATMPARKPPPSLVNQEIDEKEPFYHRCMSCITC